MRARSRNTILAAAAAGVAGRGRRCRPRRRRRSRSTSGSASSRTTSRSGSGRRWRRSTRPRTASRSIYEFVPGDAWDAKIKAAQAANVMPDVVTTNYNPIKPGVALGQFAKLDDLMPAEAIADIEPWVKDFVTAGGRRRLCLPDAGGALHGAVLSQEPPRGGRPRGAHDMGGAPRGGSRAHHRRDLRHEHRARPPSTPAGPAGVSSTTPRATCPSPTTGLRVVPPSRASRTSPSSTRRSTRSS